MFRRGMPVPAWAPGILVVALFVAAGVFGLKAREAAIPGQNYVYVNAAFNPLPASLRETDDVRSQGIRVGQVQNISYEDGQARAQLRLQGNLEVYRDATVRVRSRSLLGKKYLDINRGSPATGLLGDAVIPVEQTRSLTELDEVLDVLDAPTRAALGSTLRELGAGLGGRGGDLNDFLGAAAGDLADVGTTARALSAPEARLVATLAATDQLVGRFADRTAQVERLTGQLATTLNALNADGALETTIDRLPSTLDAATPALSDVRTAAAAITPAVTALAPGAAALGAATPDVRALLRDASGVLGNVPRVAELANPAVDELTATLRDARPLAPKLRRTLSSLAPPLGVLAPYAPEVNQLLARLLQAVSDGDANGPWVQAFVSGGHDSINTVPGAPSSAPRNPYPAPGQAATDGAQRSPAMTRSPR